jgi:hypothetical protein
MQHQFRSGRILPQVTHCASPTVAEILARVPAADWRGELKPSPLWQRVLTSARALADDHNDWELLERTRLLDLCGDRCLVALEGDVLEPDVCDRLRRLLNAALALVGLKGYHVRLTCDTYA